jgi:hypothetical protein
MIKNVKGKNTIGGEKKRVDLKKQIGVIFD